MASVKLSSFPADKFGMTIACSEHGAWQLSSCPACRALVEYEAAKRRLREVGRLVISLTESGEIHVSEVADFAVKNASFVEFT